jgi:hypothetical protein
MYISTTISKQGGMKQLRNCFLGFGFFLLFLDAAAQTGAGAFSYLSVKGRRTSAVTISINGTESGKVFAGLSRMIPVAKPGSLQLVLTDEQGARFDTTVVITDSDANKTITIKFPEITTAVAEAPAQQTKQQAIKPTIPAEKAENPGTKELYTLLMNIQGRLEILEKEVKTVSAAGGGANAQKLLSEIENFHSLAKSAAIKANTEFKEAEMTSEKARMEMHEAEQYSQKAQSEAQEAEQASVKAQQEAREAETASTKAQMEAREATEASDKAQAAANAATKAAVKPTGKTGTMIPVSYKSGNEQSKGLTPRKQVKKNPVQKNKYSSI